MNCRYSKLLNISALPRFAVSKAFRIKGETIFSARGSLVCCAKFLKLFCSEIRFLIKQISGLLSDLLVVWSCSDYLIKASGFAILMLHVSAKSSF